MHLDPRRTEDLHDYITEVGWKMAATYDPEVGQAFSTYFFRRARMRVIDWVRSTHGDSRYANGLKKLAISYPESLTDLEAQAPARHDSAIVDHMEPESLSDAIVELGRDLSPDARWALVNVAGRIAQGATQSQAISEAAGGAHGSPARREAIRRFERLQVELRDYV
jgi:DNA-directed RNA polymerase specialized sigma24 family protein